jgi:ribosomal protein L19E
VLRRQRSRRGAGSEGGAAEARVSTRGAHVGATRAVTKCNTFQKFNLNKSINKNYGACVTTYRY